MELWAASQSNGALREQFVAGRCMDFEQATPEFIAAAITEEIGRRVVYRDVEQDGAVSAAARMAELIRVGGEVTTCAILAECAGNNGSALPHALPFEKDLRCST